MALKQILLRKKLEDKKGLLAQFRDKESEFQAKETELEQAIDEAETQEDKDAVEEAIETFEQEKEQHQEKINDLEKEIGEIENQIAELERKNPNVPTAGKKETEERKEGKEMKHRGNFFGMSMEQRDQFLSREDIKGFLTRVRELMKEKRAVSGSELLIPTIALDLLRENIQAYSRLISKVSLKQVSGQARQRIAGTVPEAIWTEMCATLNELSISFNQVELDGYKVGGYIVMCNAILEDSDLDLFQEIMTMLGQSIGLALDKAIVYGTGVKMPLGIVTRLAQASKPEGYPVFAPEWKNLSTTHLLKIDSALSNAEFFGAFVNNAAVAKSDYSFGKKFWVMNEKTYAKVISKAVTYDLNGFAVSQINYTMPVTGGDVVILNFIPDGDIIGGYGDLYTLVERAGTTLSVSEHTQFIQDNTVFKGTARYDGMPVIAEAFVGININNTTVTTSVDFAPDKANVPTEESIAKVRK